LQEFGKLVESCSHLQELRCIGCGINLEFNRLGTLNGTIEMNGNRVLRNCLIPFCGLTMTILMNCGLAQDLASNATAKAVQYLPEEAIATLTLWPAQTAKLPRFSMAPIEVATAAGLEQIGIDPMRIQRIDIMAPVPVPGPAGPQFGTVIQLETDVDVANLNPQVFQGQDPTENDEKGFKFRLLAGPPNVQVIVHQASPKTLLVGTKPFVKRMIAQRRNPGSIATTLAAAKSSQDALLVLSIKAIAPLIAGNIEAMRGQLPPPVTTDLDNIVKSTDFLALRLILNESEKLQLMASAIDDQSAEELETSIKSVMDFGLKIMVQQFSQSIPQDGSKTNEAMLAYVNRMAGDLLQKYTPRRNGKRVILEVEGIQNSATIGTLVGLLLPAVQSARQAARRVQSSNNLKQLSLAMLNFESAHKKFPSTVVVEKASGKPLLSWRVAILPYIEQAELYDQFHLEEAWDSPHNIKLIDKMPAVFKHPNRQLKPGHTIYVVPVNDQTALRSDEPTKMSSITDGTSNTILLVEAANEAAVPWTAPQDLDVDFDNPVNKLVAPNTPGFQAAFCDGSVRYLSQLIDPNVLIALFTRAGGEVANPNVAR
jgi:Protein of unknown function (DUF1559)